MIDISEAKLCGISDEAALELIEWRKSIKKPLTQRAFARAMKEATKCLELGITADQAIEIAIDKGWQGVTFEYIKAELQRRGQASGQNQRNNQQPRLSASAQAFKDFVDGDAGRDQERSGDTFEHEAFDPFGREAVPSLGKGTGRPH